MGKRWDNSKYWAWDNFVNDYPTHGDSAGRGFAMILGFVLMCVLSPFLIALYIVALLGGTLHSLIVGHNDDH